MSIVVRGLRLPLATFALEVDLAFHRGVSALYGPSGSGKTSLLECLAGLRSPDSGSIQVNGRILRDDSIDVPSRLRRVGYVPQDDALFPHLTAGGNIHYGRRTDGDSAQIIDVLELRPLLERRVATLSGGERKRVALGRALVSQPEVLLLDEPLAGVDAELRGRILQYLQRVLTEFPVPTIYVSHDWDEVAVISREVAVLERGRVVRHDMLKHP